MSGLNLFGSIFKISVSGGWKSLIYCLLALLLFAILFALRVPYFYCGYFLAGFAALWIFPLFITLLSSRVSFIPKFSSSFVPKTCPWYVLPFVFWIESVSYWIRSMVLILRPVVNLAFGGLLMAIAYYFWSVRGCGTLIMTFLSYEGVVLLIHWFIVYQVLKFSQNS